MSVFCRLGGRVPNFITIMTDPTYSLLYYIEVVNLAPSWAPEGNTVNSLEGRVELLQSTRTPRAP